MDSNRPACISFRLGEEGFALPLDQVREITGAGRVIPVPTAPPAVRGVANLRGQVITLIDLARVMGRDPGLPPRAEDRLALILAPPYAHLGLYLHAPVEIARRRLAESVPRAAVVVAGSDEGGSGASPALEAAPPAGRTELAGEIVQVLSARELVERCEALVLEVFRKKS